MSPSIQSSAACPSLRFAGFEDAWQTTTISEIGKVVTGGTPDTSDRSLYGGDFMFVSPSDIGDARFVNLTNKTLTEAGHKMGRRIPKGSILFVCIGSTIGKVAQAGAECTTNQQINAVVPEENHNANFLLSLLDKESAQIRLLAGKQAVPIINKSTFASIAITLPTLPEQRKIADFLTAVDGRIRQLSQKKALLEDYKKGVMQQLFTQALRFKDDHGNEFLDWEEKQYANVYTFQNTNSFSRDLLTYDVGEVRNIHYGDIHTKFKSNFYLTKETVPFIKSDVDISRISEDCYCQAGDLVIADASEDYADVGKCIEIMDLGGQRTLAGLHTFIARPKKGEMAPGFGGYLMQCREMRLKIMTVAQGTKVLGLSKPQLSQLMLPIPSVPEQTKIANFLTALDGKIERLANQITHTQTFKKGLLQQMFV